MLNFLGHTIGITATPWRTRKDIQFNIDKNYIQDNTSINYNVMHGLLNNALYYLRNVENNFDNLHIRLNDYEVFKNTINVLLKHVKYSNERELRHAVITLYDATHRLHDIKLSYKHIEGMRDAINQFYISPINVQNIDRILRQAGFETIS